MTTFFESVEVPNLNSSSWNETQAMELRGDFPWSSLVKWDMNLKERLPEANASALSVSDTVVSHHTLHESHPAGLAVMEKNTGADRVDWTWVKGVATLTSVDDSTIDYNLYGLHHVPSGTYSMFGLPDGMRVDIRNIPTLWPDNLNVTREIILAELEKELQVQQNSLYLTEIRPDGKFRIFGQPTRCV